MAEYIDREKLIENLEQEVEEADDWKTAHEIANVAKYFPAADVRENVRGKWIVHGEPPLYVIECSCCGQRYFNHAMQCLANYCSHCGADMKGGQDG